MTGRSLMAAAIVTVAIATGCGRDAPTAPVDVASTTPATATGARLPANAEVRVLGDPRQPRVPADLARAARSFFASYLAYVYGTSGRGPRPVTPALAERLSAARAVPGLEDLKPRVRELRVYGISARSAEVVAAVDDGRASGELQTVPASFVRGRDGRWAASSVAESGA